MYDELLRRLADITALKVISRTSVMEYRGTTKNMQQIGEELGVVYLLEGRVLRAGASALYASDAIAGVFNLKDSAEGGELRLQTGQYTQGTENGYLLSVNQGFRLENSDPDFCLKMQ
jgi:hypothetical protein